MSAGIRLVLALLLVPAPAAAQGFLERFSYEGLRLSGIGVDVGAVASDRLATEVSASLRIDYGFIAPRIRTLIGVSYFRSRFDEDEIAEFEDRLRDIVVTSAPFSIDVGTITWTNVTLDLDLQYLLAAGHRIIPYIGLGIGVHVRDAKGEAIEGTFIEDALQTVAAALNVSTGFEVVLLRHLRFTAEFRGIVSSGLMSATARGGFMVRIPRGDR